ncbi:MAG: hypothetical protein M3N50_15400 [Pseudomonadota bacterium]|nr:hypothetical protein [Pseudomonadota bacterium]
MNHARNALALVSLLSLAALSAPAFAQVDLSGSWPPRNSSDALQDLPGPEPLPVDYLGLPLNDSGRAAALLVSPDRLSMPDHICAFYSPVYMMLGPFGLAISNQTESRNGGTVAWAIGGWEDLATITIHMDGRARPSKYAPHEMSGFTTGVWEDDVLVSHTTHMRASIIRRNGAPHSDQATLTMWFLRHGAELTVFARIEDPVYLSVPLYLTRVFVMDPQAAPRRTAGQPCIKGDEGVPEGTVPHFLPGKNPFMEETAKEDGIPLSAVLGGAETMYPEYRKKLQGKYLRPEKCPRVCGGPGTYPNIF